MEDFKWDAMGDVEPVEVFQASVDVITGVGVCVRRRAADVVEFVVDESYGMPSDVNTGCEECV